MYILNRKVQQLTDPGVAKCSGFEWSCGVTAGKIQLHGPHALQWGGPSPHLQLASKQKHCKYDTPINFRLV